MKMDGTQIRTGMVVEYQGKLWLVVGHEIRTPGNLSSFNQVEMKDVKTGTKTNTRFGQSDKIERVSLEQRKFLFLYAEGDDLILMDNQSYEQINIKKEQVGKQINFLQDNMEVMVDIYENTPITIALPEKVTLRIAETEPVVKGQTASGSYKPAILENGSRIMVPPFINQDDLVVVNTIEGNYVERAKAA